MSRSTDEIRHVLGVLEEEQVKIHNNKDYLDGVRDCIYWLVGLYDHIDDMLG